MLLTFDWCLHLAEIDEVMEMLHRFGAYNRAVAQGGAQSARQGGGEIGLQALGQDNHSTRKQDKHSAATPLGQEKQSNGQDLEQGAPKHSPDAGDGAEPRRTSIPSAVLSEFVASMLEQEQEPRLKKVLIMRQVQGWDRADNAVPPVALPHLTRSLYVCMPAIVLHCCAFTWPSTVEHAMLMQMGGKGGGWGEERGREEREIEEFIDNQQVTESRQAQRPVG